MNYNEIYRAIRFFVVFWGLVGLSSIGYSTEPSAAKQIEDMNKKWQSIFGNIDFTQKNLFERMIYAHPQPRSQYLPIKDYVLAQYIQDSHNFWIQQFFKGELYSAIESTKPSAYFLNSDSMRPSILVFEGKIKGGRFRIEENHNVIFLSIEPENYSVENGLTEDFVNNIFNEWVNFGPPVDGEERWFPRFTERLTVGDVFTNGNGSHIRLIADWRRDIVGFVSKTGLHIILFKVWPNGRRAAPGLAYDFDWLNQGLLNREKNALIDTRFRLEDMRYYKRMNR